MHCGRAVRGNGVGELFLARNCEYLGEAGRALADPLDRVIGQPGTQFAGQRSPGHRAHVRISLGHHHPARQPVPVRCAQRRGQFAARVDGRYHEDLAVQPTGQIVKHQGSQAGIESVGIVQEHGNRHLG